MSYFYIKKKRKDTPLAIKRRRTQNLKRQVKAYLRKHPGVANASKVFNIPEKKIYKWIQTNR